MRSGVEEGWRFYGPGGNGDGPEAGGHAKINTCAQLTQRELLKWKGQSQRARPGLRSSRVCSPPAPLAARPSQTQTALGGLGRGPLPGGAFRWLDPAQGTMCLCVCLSVSTIPTSISAMSPSAWKQRHRAVLRSLELGYPDCSNPRFATYQLFDRGQITLLCHSFFICKMGIMGL